MTALPPGIAELRPRREAMGLSLEDISIATRVSVAYLEAIEEGRLDELPEGPYRRAYVHAYREALGLPVQQPRAPRRRTGGASKPAAQQPLGLSRALLVRLGLGAVGAVGAVGVAALAWHLGVAGQATEAEPDRLEVTLSARTDRVPVLALVDGEVSFDGRLSRGVETVLSAEERVELRVPAVQDVRVVRGAEVIVPQGHQDTPRRLVFIDDGGGG